VPAEQQRRSRGERELVEIEELDLRADDECERVTLQAPSPDAEVVVGDLCWSSTVAWGDGGNTLWMRRRRERWRLVHFDFDGRPAAARVHVPGTASAASSI